MLLLPKTNIFINNWNWKIATSVYVKLSLRSLETKSSQKINYFQSLTCKQTFPFKDRPTCAIIKSKEGRIPHLYLVQKKDVGFYHNKNMLLEIQNSLRKNFEPKKKTKNVQGVQIKIT